MFAVLLLAGNTVGGYLIAAFFSAPAVEGHQSYDTTPWSEAAMAAFTLFAVVPTLLAAVRWRRAASAPAAD